MSIQIVGEEVLNLGFEIAINPDFQRYQWRELAGTRKVRIKLTGGQVGRRNPPVRFSFSCLAREKTLDGRLEGHDRGKLRGVVVGVANGRWWVK